jgi:hypothetical protein
MNDAQDGLSLQVPIAGTLVSGTRSREAARLWRPYRREWAPLALGSLPRTRIADDPQASSGAQSTSSVRRYRVTLPAMFAVGFTICRSRTQLPR